MTPRDAPELPGPWPDVLAAYADGELDPAARAAVARWLAAHPGGCAELRAQREFSPQNWPFWQQLEPPLPTDAEWAAVRDAVATAALPPTGGLAGTPPAGGKSRPRRAARPLQLAAAAAAVGLVVLAGARLLLPRPLSDGGPVPAPLPRPADDPLAGVDTLALATDADVDISRVAGDVAGWLPVGEVPLSGPLVLAGPEDVELEGADPHPAWPAGRPRMTTAPGDAPMIFAATPADPGGR